MFSVEDLEKAACKDLDLAKEARDEERRRILAPLMGAVQFLQGAPDNVQTIFALMLGEVLNITSDHYAQAEIGPKRLNEYGVTPQEIEAWAKYYIRKVEGNGEEN